MGKHVCPICEDVYAVRARVDVSREGTCGTAEAWKCPHCDYGFVSVADMTDLLHLGQSPERVMEVQVHLLGSNEVVWRSGAAPEVSAPAR